MKTRVLCFADHYLPGFRAGGPIRTLANLVEAIGDETEFLIVASDRDAFAAEPYPHVLVDAWAPVGKAMVFYASPGSWSIARVARILTDSPHDVLYLNSFFSVRATGLPLLARRLGLCDRKPAVLAPRGEFSIGALALKRLKKDIYIRCAKVSGLYRDLVWQVSSAHEARDIRCTLGALASNICIAPNIVPPPTTEGLAEVIPGALSSPLRLIFISRISPKKNLDFILDVLASVRCSIALTILGPIQDGGYWRRCQALIRALPPHISVTYAGQVAPADVAAAFARHDLFVFPTRGENFGHVVYESLAVGTPVLMSDQTPWQPDSGGAIEVVALDRRSGWIETIERWANFGTTEREKRRASAKGYSRRYFESSEAVSLNRNLFEVAKSSL